MNSQLRYLKLTFSHLKSFFYKHKGRITIPVSFLNIHFFNFEDGLSIYLMDFFFLHLYNWKTQGPFLYPPEKSDSNCIIGWL